MDLQWIFKFDLQLNKKAHGALYAKCWILTKNAYKPQPGKYSSTLRGFCSLSHNGCKLFCLFQPAFFFFCRAKWKFSSCNSVNILFMWGFYIYLRKLSFISFFCRHERLFIKYNNNNKVEISLLSWHYFRFRCIFPQPHFIIALFGSA